MALCITSYLQGLPCLNSCPNPPSMMNCDLEVYSEINPFLPKLFWVMVFHPSSKPQTVWVNACVGVW